MARGIRPAPEFRCEAVRLALTGGRTRREPLRPAIPHLGWFIMAIAAANTARWTIRRCSANTAF
jgi:hypothetical protein